MSRLIIFVFLLAGSCLNGDLFSYCKEIPPPPAELTPITQTGTRTYSCRINGRIYELDPVGCFSSPYEVNQRSEHLQIEAKLRRDTILPNIHMSLSNPLNLTGTTGYPSITEGEYDLYTNEEERYTITECDIEGVTYRTDSLHTGRLTITRRSFADSVVAGTFYFDAVSHDGQVVQVRDGRFDLRWW